MIASLTANQRSLAVLASGGIDSAVLLSEARGEFAAVYPLYIRTGVIWESAELEHLSRYLAAVVHPTLRPLVVLDLPLKDVYGEHWSMTGENVPDKWSPDEAVYLPGWNVVLLAKSLVWCHLHEVGELAIAPLAGNPFADATEAFFAEFAGVVNRAIGGRITIYSPYAGLTKREVIERGRTLPLDLTFSCLRPIAGIHCGRCNKCAERRKAFRDAEMADKTHYASGT